VTLIQTMQRHPAVTTPEATLRSAAKEMASQRAALLPVISKGKLVGTLSAMDVTARSVGGGLNPDRRTVRAVMRPDPPACRPVDQVYGQMRRLRQSVLPVIEANGELVGLVDLFDIEAAEDPGKVAGPEPDMVKRVRGEAH